MITIKQRSKLYYKPDSGIIGFDCEGKEIKIGDDLEVVKAEEMRENDPKYVFCSVGKTGKASHGSSGPNDWFIGVRFPGNSQSIGCVDCNLRKL